MSESRESLNHLTDDILEHRLDRRSLLRRAAVLGVAGTVMTTLLAACGDDDDDDDDAPAQPGTTPAPADDDDEDEDEDEDDEETPEPDDDEDEDEDDDDTPPATTGGTINIPLNGDPTMNPFTWPNQLPAILVGKNIWSTLVKYSADDGATPVPDLATDWDVTDDGMEWTFNLRDDVTWHDGEPFSSEDVEFTLMNIVNPDVRAQFRTAMREVSEVETPDATTAIVRTSEPVGSFLILLGYNIAMAPKHILDGQDLNEIPDYVQRPIGTGPFQVRQYAAGDSITLDAYEDYFEGRPNVDTVIYRVIPDINAVVAQLLTGELDIAAVEPVNLEAFQNVDHINLVTKLEPNTFFIAINNSREPFDDPEVRRALTLSINRQEIVDEILLGYAQLATSAYSPAFGDFYNDTIEPYPYDPDQAAQVMEDAGWSMDGGVWTRDGQPLAFNLMVDQGNPTREQIALVAQQYWQDFGAQVNLEVEEWSVYIQRGNQIPGDYDVRTGWRITAPDPDKISEYHSEGSVNHYAYSNPEVDTLMEQGKTELDHEARVQIYHDIQQILYDDVAICWLYYPEGIMAVNSRIQGLPEIGIRDVLVYTYRVSISE
jgi:peptide/nickel transport system substrate-binding protein